jgi:succinate dehydrogenase/fumarate reductase flavoprotein subunit
MMALHIAAVDPDSTAAGQPAWAVPFALSINRAGKRFIDESRGYVAHGKAVLREPEGVTTLVFDSRIAALPAVAGVVANFRRLGLDVHQADTIEALAAKVGLPPAETARTVAAFNDAVKDGAAASATPPKRTLAHKVEQAPFLALSPLAPGITLTFGGIMTDPAARVLEPDNRPIPGLFAAGEGAGGAFFEDYIIGGALTMCLVMGRIAGRSAAQ